MSKEEDWWSKWFRMRSYWPFSGRWMFEDMDQMFRDIEETMLQEFRKASEKAPKDLIRERTLPSGGKVKEWGPFVYGYSVTMGPEGKPRIREFGNIKPGTRMGRPQVRIQEKREPLVDVMENDGKVNIIAELPGVEKKDIELNATKENLTISVNTPQRKYYKQVEQKKGEHIPIK